MEDDHLLLYATLLQMSDKAGGEDLGSSAAPGGHDVGDPHRRRLRGLGPRFNAL
ncbi:MAG: hypothetical protein ABR575_11185 [Actinomycetota bacterium]